MEFDFSTAKIVNDEKDKTFDFSTAKIVNENQEENKPFDFSTAKIVQDNVPLGIASGLPDVDKGKEGKGFESFLYGLEAGASDVDFIRQMLNAASPNEELYKKYSIGGKDYWMSTTGVGNYVTEEEALKANKEAKEFAALPTYEERRAKLQENKEKEVAAKYPDLTEEQKNSGAALTGKVIRSIASPTTILPIGTIGKGNIVKEVAKFSGVSGLWGAEYSALQQAAETGEIKLDQLVKDSGIAAATGGVFRGTVVPVVSKAYNLIKPTKISGKTSVSTANKVLDDIEYETALAQTNTKIPLQQIPSIVKTKLKLSDDEFNNVLTTANRKPKLDLENPNPKLAQDIINKRQNINKLDFESPNKFTAFTKVILQPIHSRLQQVSPTLAARLREFEFGIHKMGSTYINRVKPFIQGIKTGKLNIGGGLWKLSKNERVKATKALMNRDYNSAEQILNKYGKSRGTLDEVRNVLDEIFTKLQNAGVKETKYIENYFPRRVIDTKGLRKEIRKVDTNEANRLTQELRDKKSSLGRNLTTEEEEAIIRNRLQQVINSKPKQKFGNMQQREIEELYENLLKYYDEPENALMEYIQGAVNVLERKKFFGNAAVSDELLSLNSNKSIAKLMADELGDFSDDALDEIETVLTARFSPQFADKASSHSVQLTKNIIYASHLGNPYNALTQLGDMGLSAYLEGILHMPRALGRMLIGKGIDIKDIGVENWAAELGTQKGWARALVDLSFKFGFAKIDRLGKNALINAAFIKVFKQVTATGKKLEKNLAKLREEYGATFGDNMDDFIDAVKRKDFQDSNVQLYLFNRLADAQPIAMSEMPEAYLRNPNGRLFYTLKSYGIKQLDIMRKDIWRNVADGIKEGNMGKVAKGFKNAMAYTLLVTGGNTTVKQVKDWTMGKDIDEDKISDDFINNIYQQFFLSRYSLERYGAKGDIPEMLIDTVVPPYQWASDLGKDVFHVLGVDEFFNPLDPFEKLDQKHKYKSLQYFPIAGRLPYWWFMGGKEDYEQKEMQKLWKGE
jgi:hypothetical protein